MIGDWPGLIFGAFLLLVLIVYVLDYLGLVDFIEAIGAILSLALGVLGMIAALLIWSARKLVAAKSPGSPEVPQGPVPDDPSVRRRRIETRTMARSRDRK